MNEYLRAAFAVGYAEVGPNAFPMTSRAENALLSAIEIADPSEIVLEAMRRLGKFEALYASVQNRRADLEKKWARQLQPIVAQAGKAIAAKVAHEAPRTPDAARNALEGALHGLPNSILGQWLKLTQDALADASAEGKANAQAYLAHAKGEPLPDQTAMRHQQESVPDKLKDINDPSSFTGDHEQWVAQQIHGLAYDIGPDLANAVEDGASYEELVALVGDQFSSDDAYAQTILNHAMADAEVQSSLDLYQSEDLEMVQWLTADDPDEECEEIAADYPMALSDVGETPPVHINCRCDLAPYFG